MDITTEMVNALAPYLKDWYARPMDYERAAKAIRAVFDAMKGKP